MTRLYVSGTTHITTGNGQDVIHLLTVNDLVGDVSIDMGAKEDHLYAFGAGNLLHGNLIVSMGQGDDFVEGYRWAADPMGPWLTVLGDAWLAGDQGIDTLPDVDRLDVGGALVIVGFE